jgi:RsmE family RNA methyltransferase
MIILEPGESGTLLSRSDRRWEHVKKVLKKKPGDRVSAGLAVDAPFGPAPGRIGEALVRSLDDSGLVLDFEPFASPAGDPPELAPLVLVLGFPRPIQAARILRDLASLGVAEIHLALTELGEKSYAESAFFRDRDFRAHLIEGAEQAGNPRLPAVSTHWSLGRYLDAVGGTLSGARLALHPYGGVPLLGSLGPIAGPAILAVGSERGWTAAEVEALRDAGFQLAGLGSRILRSETAATAASAIALARMGRM